MQESNPTPAGWKPIRVIESRASVQERFALAPGDMPAITTRRDLIATAMHGDSGLLVRIYRVTELTSVFSQEGTFVRRIRTREYLETEGGQPIQQHSPDDPVFFVMTPMGIAPVVRQD